MAVRQEKSSSAREIAMEARKREFDAKRRAANRQKGANLLGMASNPGALLRGALDIPGSVYRYVRDNEPVEIGEDVSNFASSMAEDFRKDPVKFAVDMVNPVTAVQDFADVRAQARDLRAAGDLDTASMLEQVAAMSPLAVVPVVGKVLGKSAKAAAKKAASLAVKPAKAAEKALPLVVKPTEVAVEEDFRIPAYAVKGIQDDGSFSKYDSGIKSYGRDVENVPIEWLQNLPGNELRHGEGRINQYAQSILDNGLSDPLIINVGKNTGTAKLGEGNHRLEAMRRAGFTHIPARVMVGSQYGSDLLPRSNFRGDLIPQAEEYFSADARPSSVFKSLKGVTKAHGGRVSSLAVKRKGKK